MRQRVNDPPITLQIRHLKPIDDNHNIHIAVFGGLIPEIAPLKSDI